MESSEWSDVTPISLNDGDNPPFRINYSDEYREVLGYIRASLASGERSDRVLRLTASAIQLNPANYTVWSLRRECLFFLGCNLAQELDWLLDVVKEKGCWKNYQVWQHRRVVVNRLGDASREASFTEAAFEDDKKNYHAWAHRQWVVRNFCGSDEMLWGSELAFTLELLRTDVRNNSAWNHRWFVLTKGGGAPAAIPIFRRPSPDAIQCEVQFTVNALRRATRNESAWSHLRAVALLASLMKQEEVGQGAPSEGFMSALSSPTAPGWTLWPGVLDFCRECTGAQSDGRMNSYPLEVLAEEAVARGKVGEANDFFLAAAEAEPVRKQYWHSRVIS